MTEKENILFLDIDGPLISDACHLLTPDASMRRECASNCAVGWINNICKLTHSKIVTNSTHNYHDVYINDKWETLKDSMIRWGIKEEYFHSVWRTSFGPSLEKMLSQYDLIFDAFRDITNSVTRAEGILHWLENNSPTARWVCFDDEKFMNVPNVIHVPEENGILFQHAQKALKHLGYRQVSVNRWN